MRLFLLCGCIFLISCSNTDLVMKMTTLEDYYNYLNQLNIRESNDVKIELNIIFEDDLIQQTAQLYNQTNNDIFFSYSGENYDDFLLILDQSKNIIESCIRITPSEINAHCLKSNESIKLNNLTNIKKDYCLSDGKYYLMYVIIWSTDSINSLPKYYSVSDLINFEL